jgi:hypothetical protein
MPGGMTSGAVPADQIGEYAFPKLSRMGLEGPAGEKMLVCDAAALPGTNSGFSYNWEIRNPHLLQGGNVLAGGGNARWVPIDAWPKFGWFSGEGTLIPAARYYIYRGSTGWNANFYWVYPNGSGGISTSESPVGKKPRLFY